MIDGTGHSYFQSEWEMAQQFEIIAREQGRATWTHKARTLMYYALSEKHPHLLLKSLRELHTYIGEWIADLEKRP